MLWMQSLTISHGFAILDWVKVSTKAQRLNCVSSRESSNRKDESKRFHLVSMLPTAHTLPVHEAASVFTIQTRKI
jgi:hypothetical protein